METNTIQFFGGIVALLFSAKQSSRYTMVLPHSSTGHCTAFRRTPVLHHTVISLRAVLLYYQVLYPSSILCESKELPGIVLLPVAPSATTTVIHPRNYDKTLMQEHPLPKNVSDAGVDIEVKVRPSMCLLVKLLNRMRHEFSAAY
jgi:hypothetical protein